MNLKHSFWPKIVLVIVIVAATIWQLTDAWRDSQTFDEGGHLVSGVSYWQEGNFAFNNTHPPLTKWLAGLPVVLLTQSHVVTTINPSQAYVRLLYLPHGFHQAQVILFLGRLPMILFWLGLLLVIYGWSKERWGAWAAVLAATLFAFDPSFLGHGHLIDTDVPVAAMYVATLWLGDRFFRQPNWSRLLWLTLVFGLALSTKFSAIILVPLLPILGLIRHWYNRQSFPWTWWWRMVVCLLLGGFFIIWKLYGFEIHHGLPAWDFWQGLRTVQQHNAVGHPAFLLGQTSTTGWWYYFPLAFLFKTPTITLGLLSLAIGRGVLTLVKKLRKSEPATQIVPWEFWTMMFPALLWLGVSMTSQLNIGIRHIFPIYPFIFIGIGSLVTLSSKRRWSGILVTVAMASILVSVLAYPSTISYFNGLVGGSGNGQKLLLDSNLDWGQDAWRLRNWLNTQPATTYSVELYGSIPEPIIFAEASPMLTNSDVAAGRKPTGLVIASRGAVEEPGSTISWLKRYRPSIRLWSTILVYQF